MAPDVFDCDPFGHSVVLVEEVGSELEAQAVAGEQTARSRRLRYFADVSVEAACRIRRLGRHQCRGERIRRGAVAAIDHNQRGGAVAQALHR
nr:hypothetical protein [Mycobacterium riyadhense]